MFPDEVTVNKWQMHESDPSPSPHTARAVSSAPPSLHTVGTHLVLDENSFTYAKLCSLVNVGTKE